MDVGILCHDTFFYDLPQNATADMFGIEAATYTYQRFKNEAEKALTDHFGGLSVHRGNKAFDIRENSYRVEADVAPFFAHRRYSKKGVYSEGVELRPDNDGRVINWPEQHYDNGVSKNTATRRRYKRVVRILKRLCIEMDNQGIAAAKPIPGFLVECLVWNVPNDHFGYSTYTVDVRKALAFLFNKTMSDEACSEWGEVSKLKYLFPGSKPWKRSQAHDFLGAAWDYLGFE